MNRDQFRAIQTRRSFFRECAGGIGTVALAQLLASEGRTATPEQNPLAPRKPHFAPKAKNVIFLFMEGGPSHIDLFDPKPLLQELAGKPIPDSFGRVITAMGEFDSPILASKRSWKQYGQSGTWVSDWLPHTAELVEDNAPNRPGAPPAHN